MCKPLVHNGSPRLCASYCVNASPSRERGRESSARGDRIRHRPSITDPHCPVAPLLVSWSFPPILQQSAMCKSHVAITVCGSFPYSPPVWHLHWYWCLAKHCSNPCRHHCSGAHQDTAWLHPPTIPFPWPLLPSLCPGMYPKHMYAWAEHHFCLDAQPIGWQP